MTPDDEFIAQLEGYLEGYEGSTPLPEAVRDAVRGRLPSTRQLRFARFIGPVRIALASAAAVAVTLIGINFVRDLNVGSQGLGGASATGVPTPLAWPLTAGPLEPATYVAGDPFSPQVTFTLPAGWQTDVGGPYLVDLGWIDKPGGISFSTFDLVSADPCHLMDEGFLDPPPGPSVDDLATALANMPGIEVTDLAEVTVDGYRGTQLTMWAPETFAGCTLPLDGYVIWRLPLGYSHSMALGDRHRVWILDVDGERLVIVIREPPGFTDEQRAEAQAIFDSIQIEGP